MIEATKKKAAKGEKCHDKAPCSQSSEKRYLHGE